MAILDYVDENVKPQRGFTLIHLGIVLGILVALGGLITWANYNIATTAGVKKGEASKQAEWAKANADRRTSGADRRGAAADRRKAGANRRNSVSDRRGADTVRDQANAEWDQALAARREARAVWDQARAALDQLDRAAGKS